MGLVMGSQSPKAPEKQADFVREIRPLLRRYCEPCHAGVEASGGVDIAAIKSQAHAERAAGMMARLAANIEAGIMPPEGSPRPNKELASRLTQGIRNMVAASPSAPGRVTLRRLNRFNYANTVRDLLGVDWNPTEDFPSDDVGYGFDNIGDVLSISPLLMERFLDAAEQLANRAIAVSPSQRRVIDLAEMSLDGGVNERDGLLAFFANGTARKIVKIDREGDYLLKATAFATQAGDQLAKISFHVGHRKPETMEVRSGRAKPELYELPVRLEKGTITLGIGFPNDHYEPQNPDPSRRDRNLYVMAFEVVGPIGEQEPVPASHTKLLPRRLPNETDDAYRTRIVSQFALKGYRRPPTDDEVRRLTELLKRGEREHGSIEAGFRLVVQAVLSSPKFLFRPEVDGALQDRRMLNGYELASRLSYFLWGSMPDERLFEQAKSGSLNTPEGRRSEVLRMLSSPKARGLADGFATQWLQIGKLDNFVPDPDQFPSFSEDLRKSMKEEPLATFDAIRAENRSVLEFLDSDSTMMNEVLARHYGIKGVHGTQMRRVAISDPRRGGLLTQAAILAITSNPTRTSPTKRGRWVLEQILGTPPPPPPPGADNLNETSPSLAGLSLRKKLELHRSNPDCASCHARLDPLGFGLENFDPIGRWRDTDGGAKIDSTGILPGGRKFSGPRELKSILLDQKSLFVRNLADKLLTYAIGRGTRPEDKPVIERIARRTEQNGYKFASLIIGIVESEPFLMQSGAKTK